jgi:hypothetical protein
VISTSVFGVPWLKSIGLFSGWDDDRFTWMSATTIVCIVATTATLARGEARRGQDGSIPSGKARA